MRRCSRRRVFRRRPVTGRCCHRAAFARSAPSAHRNAPSSYLRGRGSAGADLTHPLPEEPGEFADGSEATGWSAMREDAAEEREAYEQGLRLAWDHDRDFDPLLGEIEAARNEMLAAEARMRLLIAYGREFTRPRPYRLEMTGRVLPGSYRPGSRASDILGHRAER
jgi:hypothetical protein